MMTFNSFKLFHRLVFIVTTLVITVFRASGFTLNFFNEPKLIFSSSISQSLNLNKQLRRINGFLLSKKLTFNDESRRCLMEGINAVAESVKPTLGPVGRNVILERIYGNPEIVNDGVTIAREVSLHDKEKNIGAKLIQEATSKSDSKAGDGTTTTAILTQSIVNNGLRAVEAGMNPVALNQGIRKACTMVVEKILNYTKNISGIEDIKDIASIASNSKDMGQIVAQAFHKVGEYGSVILEESQTLVDELEFTEGLTFDRGFLSPHFINDNERQLVEFSSPSILVTDYKIEKLTEVIFLLELHAKRNQPLVILADDVIDEALSAMILNKQKEVVDTVAIKAPSFGQRRKEYLQDISIATGATYIAKETGISLVSVTYDMLGTVDHIVVGKELTTIITGGSQQNSVIRRIEHIRKESETADTEFDREKASERIAALGGGIARIKVGAATEAELKDKKLRYEDALNSIHSARQWGFVPGGGSCLVYLQKVMKKHIQSSCQDIQNEDELQGARIFIKTLSEPCVMIAQNAGFDGTIILSKVQKLINENGFGWGWDAKKNDYCNLIERGIVDPTKVTINVVENSASISQLVLTTQCIATNIPKYSTDKN